MNRLSFLLTGVCLASACGTTAPDPRYPTTTTGAPERVQDLSWTFGSSVTTCRIEATWGVIYTISRDVTLETTWESDSQIALVIGPGQIVSASPGDAELRMTFHGVTLTRHLRVFPGESPVLVFGPTDHISFFGRVRDSTVSGLSSGIEGAVVEVISGHNTGLSGLTDKDGYYTFSPPFICGPITVRASKSGYVDAVASSVACESGMPSPTMTPR